MIIAVAYENGNVFQHFGKTETFKIYEVDNGNIVSEAVIGTEGAGHEALADFLAEKHVDVVICGGLGDGAQAALAQAGIEVISGAEGDVDAACNAYLQGTLESCGANCDHHHDDEEDGCGGCGGGCGGCGGGCHGCHAPDFDGPNVGKVCRVHYRGTFNDGTEFDASFGREPLEFICGAGMMIHGFDKAVATMEVGQTIDIHLTPDEAYGYPDPNAIFTLEIAKLPGSEELIAGQRVILYDNMQRPFRVTVKARDKETITFDANSEMAGKELNFKIELLEVKD
ncbi:MAG: FKBP-type peptidyl-prolyl cis-trans isomerase [Clostridia bacterium]|nr:FKBP-type peptidyl-prolyl cis-trans isomerase [Clostridia bacterium]